MFIYLFIISFHTDKTEKTTAFDFLIDGELLRSTLEVYLEDKELSAVRVTLINLKNMISSCKLTCQIKKNPNKMTTFSCYILEDHIKSLLLHFLL